MELAQIYEMLNGVEGGADAVASLKKEFTTLRNEAKENRISKEEILKALNLQNGEAGKQQAETLLPHWLKDSDRRTPHQLTCSVR